MTYIGKFVSDFNIVCISKTGKYIDIREGWDWPEFSPVQIFMEYSRGNNSIMPWKRVKRVHMIQKSMLVPAFAMINGGCWYDMNYKGQDESGTVTRFFNRRYFSDLLR